MQINDYSLELMINILEDPTSLFY